MPCTEATRVISESFDRRLPWRLRAAIGVHQLSCRGCRRYRRQIEALRAALSRRLHESGDVPSIESAGLPPEVRERMRQAIRDASHD